MVLDRSIMSPVRLLPCLAVVLVACAPAASPHPAATGSRGAEGGATASPGTDAPRAAGSTPTTSTPASGGAATPAPSTAKGGAFVPRDPTSKLSVAEARRYMLALVNRDRATMGLEPVELEEGPAEAAAQEHADDMAKLGYLGHWGSDGSVPEQRYTERGGLHIVMENALGFTDTHKRELDPAPRVEAGAIEKAESAFFDEVPPNDGHRKNILRPFHRKVGIGVAEPRATATEIAVPCFAQEFVDDYGTYAEVPKAMHVGSMLHVEGSVPAPAKFAGVGLARVEAPRPLPPSELNKRRSYPIPTPYQMYWPKGFKTPIPVVVSGERFTVDVPVSDGGKRGLYELSVWANVPGTKDLTMVSLRTIRVD